MATRKPKDPKDVDQQEPEPHIEEGGAVEVHRAYLEHRLAGGEPATPEAYQRALAQFEKLPGAMRSVPPVTPSEKPEPRKRSDDDEKPEQK
jgi:hypothetical protein